MDKSELLKESIRSNYKSIRAFCLDTNIPYSTLVTAFDRGIEGMAYGTVIRICDKLELNPVDFTPLDHSKTISEQLMENKVMSYYTRLNRMGRQRILDDMQDYIELPKYVNKESCDA